jgi:hypothetical protein
VSQPQGITAQVLYEAEDGREESLGRFVLLAVKQSCRHVRNGVVAVVVRDGDGNVLGVDISGAPSEEMQEQLDLLLNDESAA